MDLERRNEAIYVYMNSKAMQRAKKAATEWFHLSEAEKNALEDEVAMLEDEAELVTSNEEG